MTAVIIVFCIIAVIFYLTKVKQEITEIPNNHWSVSFDEKSYWQHPRQYMLNYIESVPLSEYNSAFSSSKVPTLNGEKKYAVYYMPNSPDTVINKSRQDSNHPEDERGTYRGGILVFIKKDNHFSIIWESKEYFSAMKGTTEFKDINNDGIDELVLIAWQGVRLVPTFWIYQWNNDEFKLINPNPGAETESDRWMAGTDVKFIDLENDGNLEVLTLNESGDYEDIHQSASVFKFNGSEYYLWKEVAETSPEFKELFR